MTYSDEEIKEWAKDEMGRKNVSSLADLYVGGFRKAEELYKEEMERLKARLDRQELRY